MDWPIVRFVGERKGGFTRHGPTTRGYRFSPPYNIEARMHPEDAVALAATGEFEIVWPEAPAPRPTVVSPTLATDQVPVQRIADGIKIAAQRAAVIASQDVQAAQAIAAQQTPSPIVSDPVPATITDPAHPAILAMRRGYNRDQDAKMGNPAASQTAPTPAPPQRFSGPQGALRSADRPPQGAQLWQPA